MCFPGFHSFPTVEERNGEDRSGEELHAAMEGEE